MAEAEKLAIRKAFAEDLADTEISASGPFTGSQPEVLTEAGGDTVYQALIKRGWTVDRGAASTVSRDKLVDELTGWYVTCKGTKVLGFGWDYSEELDRAGAEAIVDRMTARGWAVV